jgi:hypothetical protein
MMFQLGSLLGIILGYFLCIGHAKLALYLYNHSPEGRREETDRLNAEWIAHQPPTHSQPPVTQTLVLPSSALTDGPPLSEVWNLPHRQSDASRGNSDPLIRTRLCPGGYGAAQILGDDETPSLYPGGKEQYFADYPKKRKGYKNADR